MSNRNQFTEFQQAVLDSLARIEAAQTAKRKPLRFAVQQMTGGAVKPQQTKRVVLVVSDVRRVEPEWWTEEHGGPQVEHAVLHLAGKKTEELRVRHTVAEVEHLMDTAR